MTAQPHYRPRVRGVRALGAAALLVLGTLGTGILGTTTARADASATTLGIAVPEALAPYLSSTVETISKDLGAVGITITCYVTGETVTGPYGPENVWDEVRSVGPYVDNGTFVPDALVYTGSNSAVVPPC